MDDEPLMNDDQQLIIDVEHEQLMLDDDELIFDGYLMNNLRLMMKNLLLTMNNL